jgi:hypothetical protein
MPNAPERVPATWPRRIFWSLGSVTSVLLAASGFLAFEAARGVSRGFASEMALAVLLALVVPLGVIAVAQRRGVRPASTTVLFTLAAFATAAILYATAGLVLWLR